ncbi:hypothetical protein [Bacillus sp. CHD6a]|uniref:hypothetical protein n=1 Tax=Bacillus sp. CHD6a TaxID=1643452 RepID=UPI0006CC1ED5|nr:hypothetical protein [Bacillus sp. CHD6a]KPB03070.1 hypothetical protein AAV98_19210 [Bacillus sp. CHD6a]
MTKTINVANMNIKNAVKIMMEDSQYKTFKQLAEALDVPETTFRSALNNDALRFRDLLKIMNLLGYSMKIEKDSLD